MGYGTGAIMAVPGHDERDFEFAQAFDLPIVRVVAPSLDQADAPLDAGRGRARASRSIRETTTITLDGLPTAEAKAAITAWLEERGLGKKTINYKLRDWLFSRQRYWGEPFPVVLDEHDRTAGVPESELPVRLPELEDFKPTGKPEPRLSKARDWVRYSEKYRRETNTMPQWAGSCWYYLRYHRSHRTTSCPGTPRRRSTGCRSTSTSAAPSTPCCTCSTAGSGTRCSSTAGWSARPSRFRSWSTRG